MPNKFKKYASSSANLSKIRGSSLIDIGESNVANWRCLKIGLRFKADPDFVDFLLSLAKRYLSSESIETVEEDDDVPNDVSDRLNNAHSLEQNTPINERGFANIYSREYEDQVLNEGREESSKRKDKYSEKRVDCLKTLNEKHTDDVHKDVLSDNCIVEIAKHETNTKYDTKKKKLQGVTNARNLEDRDDSISEVTLETKGLWRIEIEQNIDDQLEKSTLHAQSEICKFCDSSHSQDACQFYRPCSIVMDNVFSDNVNKTERAKSSLPSILEIKEKGGIDSKGIFARVCVSKCTQFGPLFGTTIKEKDIADDSQMKHIWEVKEGVYLNTADPEKSNWLRWLCPAPTRHDRNVVPIEREGKLYFVTTATIETGSELLYWAEMNGAWAFKKMERTCCGGCNLQFEHPMHYRIHCTIFHEASLSLTVRKYHCKVCGKAVLGKQNIMKHALINHEGKGAYQCQFCSKFFLRLNYLEMHRNYGCSANPHRARPLCDYCGRKFCQPQKLKVHIKRMHSDLAEVIQEFQCRDCLKILGSRAALQRHTKEVHKRPAGVSCSKCAKTFQNKSNLKIHMLTHSGVKPFQCREKQCSAAFTTKQCLQFHYKKIHGLNEDTFPSIVRSVEYTFESYSGTKDSISEDNGVEEDWPANQEDDNQQNCHSGGDSCSEEINVDTTQQTAPEINSPLLTEPTCEETSVIEYHSSSSLVKLRALSRTDQAEDTNQFSRIISNGVITVGQAANASLLVEAALESAEKELCHQHRVSSPPLSPGDDIRSPSESLNVSSPTQSIGSPIGQQPELHSGQIDSQSISPSLTPQRGLVMFESGVRPFTPTVCSPQQAGYLSPRYERQYLTPPPPHEFAHDDRRYHEEEIAQNLTKYKYEEARMMYHELIPRYPITAGDYYPWEVIRPAINLPSSTDLSVNPGHLVSSIDRPPSPFQAFHMPHKSPVYHHYATYY